MNDRKYQFFWEKKGYLAMREGTEKVPLRWGNLKLIGIYSSDKLVYVPIFL